MLHITRDDRCVSGVLVTPSPPSPLPENTDCVVNKTQNYYTHTVVSTQAEADGWQV